jgi:Mitochondrial K+-H+ exchange-related
MDLFLVPFGPERYELYCEPPRTGSEIEDTATARGFVARLRARFREMLALAERDRGRPADGSTPPDLWARLKARLIRIIADAVAEQRLLWHLRHCTEAKLVYPSDLSSEAALDLSRGILTRDRDRHRFWLIVDGALLLVSGALMVVPGPNLIGYYFAFRVVGHWLAWQGARQGLDRIHWSLVPSEPLAEVRRAMDLAPTQRERRLVDISSELRLNHLATFVERVA